MNCTAVPRSQDANYVKRTNILVDETLAPLTRAFSVECNGLLVRQEKLLEFQWNIASRTASSVGELRWHLMKSMFISCYCYLIFKPFCLLPYPIPKTGSHTQYMVWKFQDFSIAEILREINFGESRSSNTADFWGYKF